MTDEAREPVRNEDAKEKTPKQIPSFLSQQARIRFGQALSIVSDVGTDKNPQARQVSQFAQAQIESQMGLAEEFARLSDAVQSLCRLVTEKEDLPHAEENAARQ